MIFKARFVVPVDAPPIENGAIKVDGGRIVELGKAHELSSDSANDFSDAVIIPGLVNGHTHLELSLLAGRVPPSRNFTDWLLRLIDTRANDIRSTIDTRPSSIADVGNFVASAVMAGINQSFSCGVTTVGDITAYPQFSRPALAGSLLRAVSFGEVIAMGKGRDAMETRLRAASDESAATQRLRVGISPHAPYSVEPAALRACARAAGERRLPLCIHIAETAEEELFVRDGGGPFSDFLKRLGLWDDGIAGSRCSPVELLFGCGLLGSRTILAHANYVSNADISLIAQSESSVVYCPRTHAAFGHPPHRFHDMLRAGINVCLGTDSLASNPSLSILEELRFLRSQFPDVDPADLLALGTLRGAKALGWDTEIGSLSPRKTADFAVIPLAPNARWWDEILRCDAQTVAVYANGSMLKPPHLPP